MGAEIQKTHSPKDTKELLKLFYEGRDKTMNRGSLLHSMTEAYYKSGAFIEPLTPNPFYDGFKKFVKEYTIKPLHIEAQVHSKEYGYAGTCDLVCEINGQTSVLDWKTGKNIYNDAQLQLSAYGHAAKEMGLVEKVDTLVVVLFKEDGSYMVKQFTPDLDTFLSLKKVWEWYK